MTVQKIRCAKCGGVVAELDGTRVTYEHFHPRRRRVGLSERSDGVPSTYDLDNREIIRDGDHIIDDHGQCRGRCGAKYTLSEIDAAARHLRRTGRASRKVGT